MRAFVGTGIGTAYDKNGRQTYKKTQKVSYKNSKAVQGSDKVIQINIQTPDKTLQMTCTELRNKSAYIPAW